MKNISLLSLDFPIYIIRQDRPLNSQIYRAFWKINSSNKIKNIQLQCYLKYIQFFSELLHNRFRLIKILMTLDNLITMVSIGGYTMLYFNLNYW